MTEYLSSPFLGSVLANIIIAAVLVILMLLLRNIREQLIQKLEIFTALSVGVLLSLIFLGFIPKISQNIE
ncbi:MAG: hypothetical protein U9Q15_00460 [Patescibacteria group bacterium]|nr:hypothetical protein [Patescibacteria group bacterium]